MRHKRDEHAKSERQLDHHQVSKESEEESYVTSWVVGALLPNAFWLKCLQNGEISNVQFVDFDVVDGSVIRLADDSIEPMSCTLEL